MTCRSSRGVVLLELLAGLAVLGLAIGIAATYVTTMDPPLLRGAKSTEGLLRAARATAMATTSAYRVKPSSAFELIAETADSCAAPSWTVDPSLRAAVPGGVIFTSTSWSVCFTSGGKSTDSLFIDLRHTDHGTQQVQVLRGGTTRILQ